MRSAYPTIGQLRGLGTVMVTYVRMQNLKTKSEIGPAPEEEVVDRILQLEKLNPDNRLENWTEVERYTREEQTGAEKVQGAVDWLWEAAQPFIPKPGATTPAEVKPPTVPTSEEIAAAAQKEKNRKIAMGLGIGALVLVVGGIAWSQMK